MAQFSGIRIKNHGEFKTTLRDYMKYTKRDLKTVLDTKGFYIARGAVRETTGPSKERIKNELVNLRTSSVAPDAPLAAIIINSRRGAKGDKGLFGKRMTEAVKALVNARIRSRRFIAAGWLGAIKDLEPFAEQKNRAPRKDRAVKQFGQAKGSASPARGDSWTPRTILRNLASGDHDFKQALLKYGTAPFERAWNAEIASMKQYIEDKLRKSAQQQGIKTN